VTWLLTEQQTQTQTLVRDFVNKAVRPVAREWEHAGRYPDELIAGIKELGLLGVSISPKHGGAGEGALTCAVVIEELARGWVGLSGTVGAHLLTANVIEVAGTDEQRARLLPEMANGATLGAIVLTEPGAGSDLRGISTTARKVGDHYELIGSKTWITGARHAGCIAVLATIPDVGTGIFIVTPETPGFTVGRDIPKLGYKGSDSCELSFDQAKVPIENLLGATPGRGLQQVISALEMGRINVAAGSVGIAQESYDLALRYAGERRAFGHYIADFQAVQLKLADMATMTQAARLMTWWAAAQLDTGVRSDTETSMAKVVASEAALNCSLESMRIHGGYAISTEFDIERFYRDAPVMAIGEGTNDILKLLIARNVLKART
jgi:alkylation response protein AidB-like acyl-CoA dehydrogenase